VALEATGVEPSGRRAGGLGIVVPNGPGQSERRAVHRGGQRPPTGPVVPRVEILDLFGHPRRLLGERREAVELRRGAAAISVPNEPGEGRVDSVVPLPRRLQRCHRRADRERPGGGPESLAPDAENGGDDRDDE
jgi:hypothetical protein